MFRLSKFTCFIILFAACLRLTYSTEYYSKSDKIAWDVNYRLTFDDFRGRGGSDTLLFKNDMEFKELGKITKAIIVNTKADSKRAEFTINAVMDRSKSWIRYANDTACLKHEQGHFDICEIYARLLRKKILEAKSLSDAKEMYYQVVKDEETEQKLYDRDNSGLPEGINSYWEEKIISRLEELAEYDNPQVTVKFRNG